MSSKTDTKSVRQGEELDLSVIEPYLRAHLHVPDGKIEVRQFGAGHSNLTYELAVGDWSIVLRRPPLGPVAPKAHDMEREYMILKALHPFFSIAPKPMNLNNGDLIGVPFFIMERKVGVVYDTSFPDKVTYTSSIGRKISEEMVDRLVELHSINYKASNLKDMVKPEGFMERQVHGWIKRFDRSRTDDVVSGNQLKQWLLDHIPYSTEASVIHYDYKLNNAMFDPEDPARMIGLFDWEMTTVGDPLADLGVAMSYWIQPDDPDMLRKGLGEPPVTIKEGFYTREEFIQRYAEKSGRDVTDIHVYLTFAYFKLAGIIQQIYARYKKGQTNDPRFENMNLFVNNLIDHAERTAGLTYG